MDNAGKRERVADKIIRLALDAGLELFNTPTGETYGRVPVNEHREVHRVNSKALTWWLRSLYYAETGHGFSNRELEEVINHFEAKAAYDGKIEPVYVRVAGYDGKVYVDLANDQWEVVEVTSERWKVVRNSSVNFRRAESMQPLPKPTHKHHGIVELKDYISFSTEKDFVLTASWLVGAYHPYGSYTHLVLVGQAGAGKTTSAKMLGMLIDPRKPAVLVGTPEPNSIEIIAKNTWLPIFDNLSTVPVWLSDRLCTLSTGGGSSKRTLYTNDGETLFDSKRPVILTGIDELATRGDLIDRSILVYPQRITHYRTESELLESFTQAQPRLLGAVLDGVVSALANKDNIHLDNPRMADFAVWATAAESGLGWEPGTFMQAYEENKEGANELAIDASLVGSTIRDYMIGRGKPCEERGTAEWLQELNSYLEITDSGRERVRSRTWPRTPNKLSSDINRIAPNLRSVGIHIEKLPRTKYGQDIRICKEAV